MKNSLIVIFLMISTVSFSQDIVEKQIGEFKELKVYDLIQVKLVQSSENKIEITGEHKDQVVFVNKNGKLKIKMDIKEAYNGDDTKVILYYTSCDVIDANEGASIYSNDVIKQFDIELSAQEGAKIDVELESSYATIKAYTGGHIKAKGTSKNQTVSVSAGGIYEAKNLITETTQVKVKAGGDASVHATELADLKITAGGSIYIYGNPKEVNESKAMGGTVKRMD
ncbi:head GIN domain-containing protein [Hanstruepera marina]|uniref:head GIN domain-containing protein n=1 Tax=Hanstruepera marina TaxID=2873265 RepID=UPI002106B02E|nr:head GIN domain-containing protein [Hanstruepera marina]